jgi:hypothetical protein
MVLLMHFGSVGRFWTNEVGGIDVEVAHRTDIA